MSVTEPLVLPADLLIFPVADLPADTRRTIPHQEGDFAVTRPRSRVPSRVVDAHAAEFLRQFRSPVSVIDAVVRFSRERQLDPERTLEESFSLIQDLMGSRLLLPADSAASAAIEPLLELGSTIAGYRVKTCVSVSEDTEVYQVIGAAGVGALKVARTGCPDALRAQLRHEAEMLARLDGQGTPRLLEADHGESSTFLICEWCDGVPVVVGAEEHRRRGDPDSRRKLAALCHAVLLAFAHVHEQGVAHGDIHPMNVLVDAKDEVHIIDFGLATHAGTSEARKAARGGVAFYFEPEYARAVRDNRPSPPATPAGEQYSVAALVCQLLTGVHYVDFSLEPKRLHEQIIEAAPLAFSERNVEDWDNVERVLQRALTKEPAERFSSMREFADAFAAAAQHDIRSSAPPAPVNRSEREAFIAGIIADCSVEGPLYRGQLPAPTATIKFGAAGVALGLLQIAGVRHDASLLSTADLWLARARREAATPGAFENQELDVTPTTVGRVSPFHSAAGIHFVQAMLSHAMSDPSARANAIAAFIAASDAPCEFRDITLGRLSTVLGSVILLALLPDAARVERDALQQLGADRLTSVWNELDVLPPIANSGDATYLGAAHGWAGFLYAALQWSRVSGEPLPTEIPRRLDELAELTESSGRGVRWPCMSPTAHAAKAPSYMSGWCNGSAGMVFLWSLAYEQFKHARFATLAERSGFNAWESGSGPASLCCGLAGQAYAMLNLHRLTGESVWARRAEDLVDRAITVPNTPESPRHSLYKGAMGVAVAAVDLEMPRYARMPMFEV